jgi:hypothetical protein
MRRGAWCLENPAFTVGGAYAEEVAVFTMSYSAQPAPVPYRFAVSLRTGALLRVECDAQLSYFRRDEVGSAASQLATFGHWGVVLHGRRLAALVDLDAASLLHPLQPAPPPAGVAASAHMMSWSRSCVWSVDGAMLAVWRAEHAYNQPDEGLVTVLIYRIGACVTDADGAGAELLPQPGPLAWRSSFRAPKIMDGGAAFGSGGAFYTASMRGQSSADGALHKWDATSGLQLESVDLTFEGTTMYSGACSIAISCRDVFIALGGPVVHAFDAATLRAGAPLRAPPLRGGHGDTVVALQAVGDVVLTVDAGGLLLVWDAPSRTLLRRLARDAYSSAPQAKSLLAGGFAITRRGVALVETAARSRHASQTRLLDWA